MKPAPTAALPATLRIPGPSPARGTQVRLLGGYAPLAWTREGDATVVTILEAVRTKTSGAYAWAFRLPAAAVMPGG